ncbi:MULTISPECIES: FAD-dependent oxidoreductase [unclassified Burkholderia]|uniref:oxidoreductase n=1 Tax=unclassified Burkholderia TaxID=2613784 RepID=UPI000FA76E9E|nr:MULTISPECIES: FAD-dependent oxidoreductase [unclassified Burkholderia]RQS19115.1 FAD-dependent oxidoreductase [Burkholderia sp. Bp8995]RQS38876.1 FAD-dependent oxidoreductase [Burkholderia sp. Bp8989]
MISANAPSARGPLDRVLSPLQIGPVEVKNRIMMTAQTLLYGRDNILGDRHVEYYRERARGGCALFICEQQGAYPVAKGSFHEGCSAYDERCIPQYEKLAGAVHEHGAKQFVQLFGTGVHDRGTTITDEWHPLWAASAVRSITHNEVPLVMGDYEIGQVVQGFGRSALNVKTSGCDGVELHAAHSYLLGQFLSPAYNKRTDRYGGSVAKRCQLLLDIGEEIRKNVGAHIAVGVRISFDEYLGSAGITPEQSEEQLEILASSGLFDFFNISAGGYHTLHMTVAPMSVPQGYLLPFGRIAKRVIGNRGKVFIVGRIKSLQLAEEALQSDAADMVALTRAQMAEPMLVRKTLEGRISEIKECVGANECIARIFENRPAVCLMNPQAGREWKWNESNLSPVATPRRILVVGGGMGGMHTAQLAARRGHSVTLIERSENLGGRLDLLKRFPSRDEWQVAINNLARAMDAAGVVVRLGETATLDLIRTMAPDCVVLATGSTYDKYARSPFRPDRETIPGIDQANVLDMETGARATLADARSLGKKVIILDETGEYLPFGVAEVLSTAGVDVEIISPQNVVGADTQRRLEYSIVLPRLTTHGVRITPQQNLDKIDGTSVWIVSNWGGPSRLETNVDTVLVSIARKPQTSLSAELRGIVSDVRSVGDCVAPRSLAAVIFEAEEMGRTL